MTAAEIRSIEGDIAADVCRGFEGDFATFKKCAEEELAVAKFALLKEALP
ncbi:MAG: hypothetical protein M3186_08730 [Actinomycetota bacterium]|nr:hypothetical protein [Actinomycetota bacterium]